ncbi:hypothetical protein FHY55_19370 [Oceanicola sp. D3]|uniref:hypothetical protein n=1 Tax=Oceanicola sp. D3 TaxID=2587163 RepID=UPI0011230926|nr:hypothetical protein [Oceanicola sp. D3]QDC11259.1 hypothetical protein FHY55_19370 [Oceanicola sp. D3]
MDKPSSVRDIVALWPSRLAFADAIGLAGKARVDKWIQVNSIPAPFLYPIFQAAMDAGIALAAEDVMRVVAADAGRANRGEAA